MTEIHHSTTEAIPVQPMGAIGHVWRAGVILQILACLPFIAFGAWIAFEDMQERGEFLDGFGLIAGGVIAALGLAVAIWSYLSIRLSRRSAEVAAIMAAIAPAAVWIIFGPLLNFDDHPSLAVTTGIALLGWIGVSVGFARTDNASNAVPAPPAEDR